MYIYSSLPASDSQVSVRCCSLLGDNARSVTSRAVVGGVLVVVGERVEADVPLKRAESARREVIRAVVGRGHPGEAEAVRSGGIRAAVADGDRDGGLSPGGERHRGLQQPAVRCAAP